MISGLRTYKKMLFYESRQSEVIKKLEKFIVKNKLNRNIFNNVFELLMKPNYLMNHYDEVLKAFLQVSKQIKDSKIKDELSDIVNDL